MTSEILKNFMELLVDFDCHIAEKTITIEELKSLILIIYNEVLNNDEPNKIIKDYLTLVVKHFIELENEIQLLKQQKEITSNVDVTASFIHRKLTQQFEDEEKLL